MASVESFDSVLTRWRFEKYIPKFEQEGWDDVESWSELLDNNGELLGELIGKKGHRSKFIRNFQKEFGTSKENSKAKDSDEKDSKKENKTKKVAKTPKGKVFINPKTNKPLPGFYLIPRTASCSDPKSTYYKNFSKRRIIISGKQHKVILVVGETGSGKSTVLNSMINYLYGVEFSDKFRYKLIMEKAKKSDCMSQTDYVTSYELPEEGMVTNYSLTVVDTPGFGDTRGVEHDTSIMKDIKCWFEKKLETLDAVCFVVKASETRLTHTQQYIFQSILNLFGKNVKKNIFALITFADASDPPALNALKDGGIPFNTHFRLNNCVFYKDPINKGNQQTQMFDKYYWDMGMMSFKSFFDALYKTRAVSLTMTREVLNARQIISEKIADLNMTLDVALEEVREFEKQKIWISKHAEALNANKSVPYYEKKVKWSKEYTGNSWVTTCKVCPNMTCHSTCWSPFKTWCCMMKNNKCIKCGCPDTMHENCTFVWKKSFEKVKKTNWDDTPDMKNRYNDSLNKKTRAELILHNCDNKLKDSESYVSQCIIAVKNCINQLSKIALNNNVLSTKDYIAKIIEVERNNKKKGFQQRIESLEKLGKETERIEQIQNGQFNFKQFIGWNEQQDEEKNDKKQSKSSTKSILKKLIGWG